MRHPSDGTIRRLIDEPAGVADTDRAHVAGCPECLRGLAAAQQDAAVIGTALDEPAAVDVDRAWHRLSASISADARGRAPAAAASSRWRAALRRPVVAALGVVLVLAGGGIAAAADWLQIFRTEEIAPVTVTQGDLVALPDLSAYGELTLTQEPQEQPVADAAAAEKATGLSVPQVRALPAGVTGEPTYQAVSQGIATFTFSADRAAQAAAASGESLPPVPAGLDGSSFRLTAGPGVAAFWSEARGVPAMVVARAVAPTVDSSGVPFETARDYLLSLPGIPQNLAAQLRTLSGDGTTLPLPLPAELVTTSTTEVGESKATVVTTRDGLMAGVVWVKDGVVTAVAGSLSAQEVLTVARGLR